MTQDLQDNGADESEFPSVPRADLGRRVRALTGVREDLLDQVPSERPRYTGLGWTMLGTGALATIGMAVLITQISGLPTSSIVILSICWGLFILGIDYLIISYIDDAKVMREVAALDPLQPEETSASKSRSSLARNRTIIRILLAAFLGITVAESIVLVAFASAANATLDEQERARLETDLCRANAQLVIYRPLLAIDRCNLAIDEAADPSTEDDTSATPSNTFVTTEAAPPTIPPPDLTVYDTTALEAELEFAEGQIAYYIEAAACEDVPDGFSEERREFLLCTGVGGQGRNWREKIEQKEFWESERDLIRPLIADLVAKKAEAQLAYDARVSELAEEFNTTQAEAQQEAQDRIREEADEAREAAEREEEQRQQLEDELFNDPEAIRLSEQQRALQDDIARLEAGDNVYGLNERFVATEETVDWRIKWGLRLLFIFVDMTPVLLKLTLGTSTVEMMAVMQRRGALYPRMSDLKLIQSAYETDPASLSESSNVPSPGGEARSSTWRRAAGRVGRWGRRSALSAPAGEVSPITPERGDQAPDSEADSSVDDLLLIDARSYRRGEMIGSGAFARIYRANPSGDYGYPHPVVAKIPKKGRRAHSLLAHELQLYRRLRAGTGVANFVGGDATGIVIQYYPRTSLDRWYFGQSAAEHVFTLEDWINWLHDLAVGLGSIWRENQVHGDGKPANILLTGSSDTVAAGTATGHDNTAVIADLGSAVEVGDRPATFSYGFSPPEYLANRGKGATATPVADVYSFLGSTSYYMLSGGVEPWLNVLGLGRDELKSDPIIKLRRRWLKAIQSSPLTPLVELNPAVPPPVARQVGQWMASDPLDRLHLSGKSDENWQIGQHRWNGEQIRDRLTNQIAMVSDDLLRWEPDRTRWPTFGRRHELAFTPEDFPDDTVDFDLEFLTADGDDDL